MTSSSPRYTAIACCRPAARSAASRVRRLAEARRLARRRGQLALSLLPISWLDAVLLGVAVKGKFVVVEGSSAVEKAFEEEMESDQGEGWEAFKL